MEHDASLLRVTGHAFSQSATGSFFLPRAEARGEWLPMSVLRPILLVEDSARDLELTLAALENSNLANRVVVRHDGREALEYLHEHADSSDPDFPAVMLLDINMPNIGGIEVLREIKSSPHLKALPVVMLTSSHDESDLKTCYSLGANGYVVKPVDFAEFHEALKALGIFWAIVNESPESESHKEEPSPVEIGA